MKIIQKHDKYHSIEYNNSCIFTSSNNNKPTRLSGLKLTAMKTFKIGQEVTRLGSVKDYCTGRKGVIVEIKLPRIRVRWLFEPSGNPIKTGNAKNGIRTLVNEKYLE